MLLRVEHTFWSLGKEILKVAGRTSDAFVHLPVFLAVENT
jgi:hypothetical protein